MLLVCYSFLFSFVFLLCVHASKSISRPAYCSRSKLFNQHKSIFSTLFGIRCEILNLMRIALSMRYAIHICIIYLFRCSFHAHLHSYFMYIGESFMLCNFGKRENFGKASFYSCGIWMEVYTRIVYLFKCVFIVLNTKS